MNIKLGCALSAIMFITPLAFANTYQAPGPNQSLIGEIQYTNAGSSDTVASVSQRYDLGYNAIRQANPYLNVGAALPSGASIKLPTQHLVPNHARRGIIINLPEMRMYFFPGNGEVLTYPIGIGKIGKTIPITKTYVTRKATDPSWIPPDDIREFNLEQGIVLPKVMPPGPDNPLGPYAIYMGVPTYLIHSTPFPESVGKRASFGCIRMFQSDISHFFPLIKGGIPVAITNSPVKVGWQGNSLYVEAHPPLEEHHEAFDASLPGMVHMVNSASKNGTVIVDWQAISYISRERDGVPHQIGIRVR